MKLKSILMCSTLIAVALPASAEETRELGAHVHGHGALNVALEGNVLAMELEVPGFDIVGFEHPAETEADKAAIAAGLAQLENAAMLFSMPPDAGCQLTEAHAVLHGDDHHEDHDEHEGHDHEEHGHDDDHAEHGHEDHAHEDAHAEDKHEDHDHGDHDEHDDDEHADDEHAHDAHDEDAHEEGESHSEFHAEYAFVCQNLTNVDHIDLSYFNVFENAEELQVQVVSASGAYKVEVTGASPAIEIR